MPSAPRASANDAFALVCALRQAPSSGCTHASANTLPLFLSSVFAGFLLSVWEHHFLQKQIKNGDFETFVPLYARWCPLSCPRGYLPQSTFLGDTGSRSAPPIGVSPALALSLAALLIGGVWPMAVNGAPSISLMFCPAILLQAGSWNFSCSTPGSSLL